MFDDRYMTMFEGILVTFNPSPGAAPAGFEPFGTITLPGQKRAALFISEDGLRLIAGATELADLDLIFARWACENLRRRRAALENDPRRCANRKGAPTLCSATLNSSGGRFS
jgi:hypothetical protein